MVPSTYEDGTLYNVLPSGNKAPDETGSHNGYDQTRADFTFSRGSNLAATRVNSDGLIEKGRENLLLQSNSFDTTWAKSNASVTSGQADKDGGTDAWKLNETATTGEHQLKQNYSDSGVNCLSIYAKAGERDVLIFRMNLGGWTNVVFNLTSGSVVSTGTFVDATITNVGGGWYRCEAAFNGLSGSTVQYQIGLNDTTYSYAGEAGKGIYIQNAQLEKGLVATDYIETGSTTAQAGILEDMPRINYDANGENGALLLEPSRTNLLPYSDYLSGYTVQNLTIDYNNATSPEGLQNATKLTDNSTSGFHRIINSITTTAQDYTLSVYLKAGTMDDAYMQILGGGTVARATFDLDAGTTNAINGSSKIEDAGSGWYRCSITGTANAGTTYCYLHLGGTSTYVGTNQYLHYYGLQMEAGSYATSYVPTYGSAVTRSADSCRGLFNGDNIFDSNWTAMVELVVPNQGSVDTSAGWGARTTEGSTSNSNWSFILVHRSGGLNLMTFGTQTSHNLTYTFGDTLKLIVRSDGYYFYNGTKYTLTGLSSNEPVEVGFGRAGQADFSAGETADIKQTMVFDSALTDAECVTLTTL